MPVTLPMAQAEGVRLLIDCPQLGLSKAQPLTLIPKPQYSRGEVVVVHTASQKIVLCAFLLKRNSEFFFYIPCPIFSDPLRRVHFFSADVCSISILGSVKECDHLRLLMPVPD